MMPGQSYLDRRLLGVERWCLGEPDDARMRMPNQILRSVVFIGAETSSGFKIGGTAFAVGIPVEGDDTRAHRYLVTAKHNVENAKQMGTVGVRVNLRSGGTRLYEAHTDWVYSDNDSSDAAVMPLAIPEEVECATIRNRTFATAEAIASFGIGLGDDLAVVGLFSKRIGDTRNLPIIRTGSIAAMPSEPLIDQNTGGKYDAYLVEVRSIGGLSGSPVYVVIRGGEPLPSGQTFRAGAVRICLLGLIRGHWNKSAYEASDFLESEVESFNTGIAIVTPIADVIEILGSEGFVKDRKRAEKIAAEQNAPVEDSAQDDSEFDRFEDLTRKLVNVPKREIDEKRKGES